MNVGSQNYLEGAGNRRNVAKQNYLAGGGTKYTVHTRSGIDTGHDMHRGKSAHVEGTSRRQGRRVCST